MQENGKVIEIARVIVCNSIELQSRMNKAIEELNKQNFIVKHHSIAFRSSSMHDVICTMIFESKKL